MGKRRLAEDPDRDFWVDGVQCRTQRRWNVKVGTSWPKKSVSGDDLAFMVKLRNNEDHEQAAKRWLESDRGLQHAAAATCTCTYTCTCTNATCSCIHMHWHMHLWIKPE